MGNFDVSYLTTDSIDEGVGSSQILPLLVKLSTCGLNINLISYEKSRPSAFSMEILSNSGIVWTPLYFDQNARMGPLKRLYELTKSIPPTSVIHARSDIPAMSGVLSNMGPVLWDIRSLWADQRRFIEPGKIKKLGLIGAKVIEKFDARYSDGISTLSHAVVSELEFRYKNLSKIRTVVPTFVDLAHYIFSPRIPIHPRALFSGTYNGYYDLNLSSEFCEALRKKISLDIHWARPKESPINTLGAGEDQILGVTRSEMPKVISDSSFGVSICRNDAGVSLKAAVPTKIAEFLAVGRPVVINKGLGDFDEMFKEFNVGVILDGSPENFEVGVNQMLMLIKDPETPYRCRALAEKYFSLELGVTNYLEMYGKLTK